MIQTFTPDDAVRYLYCEMSSEEADKMKEILMLDDELMDTCQQLASVKKTIENHRITREPSQKVIDSILAYSKSYDTQVST